MQQKTGAVAVIGGGIAGIQAALDLADSGFYTYLVEKKPGLGGIMAQLDSIAPASDCSPCLLTTRLIACARHANIEIHTRSRVLYVEGEEGNMQVHIRKSPAFIDPAKCIACNWCTEACLKAVPDEFNLELKTRKCAYIYYRQSIPSTYVIDQKNCLRLTRGICGICEKICPAGAIDFNEPEKTLELQVDSVIMATGMNMQNSQDLHDLYSYKSCPDVITSLEYERLTSITGPGHGILKRPSDNTRPAKTAWIQCVLSRSLKHPAHRTCSSICCMHAVKQASSMGRHIGEKIPDTTVFYNEIRFCGKGQEKLLDRARSMGVRFICSQPHSILPGKDGKGVRITYVHDDSKLITEFFDLAVLSVGMHAGRESLQQILGPGITISGNDSIAPISSTTPFESSRKGIYLAGSLASPGDIRHSITHGSGAAVAATERLTRSRFTLTCKKEWPPEKDVSGQQPRIGVFICACGGNISDIIDINALKEFASGLKGVVLAETNKFTCPQFIQDIISSRIIQENLNRVVVAACTPVTHQSLYQDTLKKAGLNPNLLEMANIRNQNSWMHQYNPALATAKARLQVSSAVAKAGIKKILKVRFRKIIPRALVVGGGLTGMTTALSLADQGTQCFLVERSAGLGGHARDTTPVCAAENTRNLAEETIARVQQHPLIITFFNSRVVSCKGSTGNFISNIQSMRKNGIRVTETIRYGAAVLCTGAMEAKPLEYLYAKAEGVFTQDEFCSLMQTGKDTFKKAASVVFIQCVGSRETNRPYCSRTCCIRTLKTALKLKEINPGIQIYVINRQMNTCGDKELLYEQARREGVIFIKYTRETSPLVQQTPQGLNIMILDHVLKRPVGINTRHLVLATGIVPDPETTRLAAIFNCSLDSDLFLQDRHYFLHPCSLDREGIFAAGLCLQPGPMEESLVQARAAVSGVRNILFKKQLPLESSSAYLTAGCDGCGICIDRCPYAAIKYSACSGEKPGSGPGIWIDEELCEGCGACVSACPGNGVAIDESKMDRIRSQVLSMLHICKNEPSSKIPLVIAFCCSRGPYMAADTAGALKQQSSPCVIIIKVNCIGDLSREIILESLQQGIDGIMILGCPPGECRYRHGDMHIVNQAGNIRAYLRHNRINPDRLMLGWLSSVDGTRIAGIMNTFARRIRRMNLSAGKNARTRWC